MVKQGDIIKINFDPQVGHEQSGYRPAVVLSNNFSILHHKNVVYICPISNSIKPYPTHVLLDERTKTTGVIFCEHVKSLDLIKRTYTYIEKCPSDILSEVINRVKALIDIPD